MHFRTPAAVLALLATLLVTVIVAMPFSSTSESSTAFVAQQRPETSPSSRVLNDGTPEQLLPRAASGRAAIRLADTDFAAAAALNRMSPQALRALLLNDPTTNLDETGKLFYRDLLAERSAPAARVSPAPYPTSQTFTLHSKPGSQRTIYLDFNGARVSGTAWNGSGANEIPDGDVPGFSLDSNFATFNADEHATIQQVWQRVAEDFAPFDVDVTTQQPTAAQIVRTDRDDMVFGTTTVITADVVARDRLCGGPGCTGVAYTDVFDIPDAQYHSYYQPAWAFTATYNDVRSIAETVSHEVGHNFGLVHDGKGTSEPYYRGHGIWTPIMGSGPGPVTQWSNASYTGGINLNSEGRAGALQDDVALIAQNGAPYRADEVGGTVATAGSALPTGVAVIGRRDDVDMYRIGICTGSVTVTAASAPSSPNLDIKLSLVDVLGTELASADPPSGRGDGQSASGMGASVTYSAIGQVLYAAVDGVGNGTVNTGYDDYGSLGQYTLTESGCSTGLTDIIPTSTATPGLTPTTPLTTAPPLTGSPSSTAEPATVPDPPIIGRARPGPKGTPFTGKIWWSAPADDGGSDVTNYVVRVHKVNRDDLIVATSEKQTTSASRTKAHLKLRRGRWAFSVVAVNEEGRSQPSDYSRVIRAR